MCCSSVYQRLVYAVDVLGPQPTLPLADTTRYSIEDVLCVRAPTLGFATHFATMPVPVPYERSGALPLT